MATTITANGINFPDGSASAPSIGGTDTNTGLFTGSDIVGFATGGEERIRINSTGQLELQKDQDGVTGRPVNRIVFKDLDASVAAGQPIGEISWYSTDSGMANVNSYIRGINEATNGSGALAFGVKASGSNEIEALRIDSSGRLRIGNTTQNQYTAADDLIIGSGSGDRGLTLYSGSADAGVIAFSDGTSDTAYRSGQIIYDHSANSMVFRTNGNYTRLTLDNAGNVGIGISPSKKLTVFGTGAGEATVQIEGEGGADPYINFLANNTQHWSLGVDDSDSDKFKLSKHSALGTNDYLVVDTSGNVGIGTSSFTGKFVVQDSSLPKIQANFNGAAHLESGVGGSGGGFAITTGHFLTFNHQPYANRGTDTNLTERMRIRSDGKISIGTSLNVTNTYEFSLTGADATGGFYAHGRNHYLSNRSNAYASLTIKKSNADSDAIDYLQIRDSGNNLKSQITGAGNWKPIAGGGIDFSATAGGSADDSTLDDYERGGFNPTVGGSTASGVKTYTHQSGYYVKIGKVVHCWVDITIASAHSMSGVFAIQSLPYAKTTHDSQNSYYEGGSFWNVSEAICDEKPVVAGYMPNGYSWFYCYKGDDWGGKASFVINTAGRVCVYFVYTTS